MGIGAVLLGTVELGEVDARCLFRRMPQRLPNDGHRDVMPERFRRPRMPHDVRREPRLHPQPLSNLLQRLVVLRQEPFVLRMAAPFVRHGEKIGRIVGILLENELHAVGDL